MADEELTIEVEGEGLIEGADVSGELDPASELKRQFAELQADNKKRAESEAAALRRANDERMAADAARREAIQARAETAASQTNSVDAGLAAAQAEADSAEAEYAALMEKGDFAGAAKANRRVSKAEARIVELEGAKANLEARSKSNGGQQDIAPARSADPFEDHLRQFTAPTADWMRQHRDWVVDPRKSSKLQGAHHMAIGDGLTADTPEYFEHVEKTLGMRDAQAKNGADNSQQARMVRRSSPVVAPVSGGAGSHSSGANENRGVTVTLTKGEKAAATDGTTVWNYDDPSGKGKFKKGDPIGVQEYARRKLDMQKKGFYDRSYTEG